MPADPLAALAAALLGLSAEDRARLAAMLLAKHRLGPQRPAEHEGDDRVVAAVYPLPALTPPRVVYRNTRTPPSSNVWAPAGPQSTNAVTVYGLCRCCRKLFAL